MVPTENSRVDFNEGGESPARFREEVWIGDAPALIRHDQKIISSLCPVQFAIVHQARLEMNEWLLSFDFEGGRSAIAA